MTTLPPFPVDQDIHPELRAFLNETRQEIRELKNAIVGNPEYHQPGLAQDVADLKIRQEKTEQKIFKASVVITTAGALVIFLKDFVISYFTKPNP